MLVQVLGRERWGGLSKRCGKPPYEPIFQNADTTDAAFVKVLPGLDQVWRLRQRHLLCKRLKDSCECAAVGGFGNVIAREVNIDAPAAQLSAEIPDAE